MSYYNPPPPHCSLVYTDKVRVGKSRMRPSCADAVEAGPVTCISGVVGQMRNAILSICQWCICHACSAALSPKCQPSYATHLRLIKLWRCWTVLVQGLMHNHVWYTSCISLMHCASNAASDCFSQGANVHALRAGPGRGYIHTAPVSCAFSTLHHKSTRSSWGTYTTAAPPPILQSEATFPQTLHIPWWPC